jgi:hypothetical protein
LILSSLFFAHYWWFFAFELHYADTILLFRHW